MKKAVLFIFGTVLVSVATLELVAQRSTGPSQVSGTSPALQALTKDLDSAVSTGRFVEENGEYKLDRKVDAAKGTVRSDTVEFQIGTINGKPAFVPFALPTDSRVPAESDVKAALSFWTAPKTGRWIVLQCAPGYEQVCSVTREGKCVKYTCEPKK